MDDASQATGSRSEASQPRRGTACPRCGCRHFRTTHTESLPSGRIRRRKVCRHCGRRMVTYAPAPRRGGPDRSMGREFDFWGHSADRSPRIGICKR
jgi:hypothetical protein